MSENLLPPRIKFFQYHQPETLFAGRYFVKIENKIDHNDINERNPPIKKQYFSIHGERFLLNDQDIRAVFPAPGSTGSYANVLPHITLHRNTLPWERRAYEGNESLAWLALLLFDEDELPQKEIVTVAELQAANSTAHFPTLPKETAQKEDEQLTIIDVPKDLLIKILPSGESLALSAHSRQGVDEQNNPVGEENATILCNRLPEQGKRSTLHLVSLEGRYNASGFDYSSGAETYRFVSLKSWEFYTTEHFKITSATLKSLDGVAPAADLKKISTLLDREFACAEAAFLDDVAKAIGKNSVSRRYRAALVENAKFDKTFDGLLTHLNKDTLTLRLPPDNNAEVEQFYSQGLSPVEHHFRNGDKSVSWYRGPFVPYSPGAGDDASAVRKLKPETSDELMQFNADNGMFDITYSAAWELGRLLALASKDFSVNLFQWKRLLSQHRHKSRQQSGNEHLPVFAHTHNHELEAPLWEQHLQPWLEQLAAFQGVPANYLIPNEKLLPRESIRFFHIDKNWQVAALSGAFSIAGEWDAESQTDDNPFNSFLGLGDGYTMGFLLRSDVVSGWPGLIVDALDTEDKKQTPLRRQLDNNLVLYLFKKEIKHVVFHQKPEVMHFGVIKDNAKFSKNIRDENGRETGDIKPVNWQSKKERVVDMHALARTLGKANMPAQFAMNMIAGAPRIIFEVNS